MQGFFGSSEPAQPSVLEQLGNLLGDNKYSILAGLAGAMGGEGGWDSASRGLLGFAQGSQIDDQNRQTRTARGVVQDTISKLGLNPQQAAAAQGLGAMDPQTAMKVLTESAFKPKPAMSRLASPQEIQAAGLPQGTVAQIGGDGGWSVLNKPETQPNDIREYNFAMQQRREAGQPIVPFDQYQREMKQAGAIRIDNSQKLESEEQKKKNEFTVGYFGDIVKEAPVVRGRIADLNQLADLGTAIQTGPTANIKATLDGIGVQFGLTDGQFKSVADGINALTNRLAPALRQPGSGSQSDAELRGFLQSLPNLANLPNGNQLISSSLRRAAAIEEERAQVAELYISGRIPQQEAWEKMREINSRSIFNSKEEADLVKSLGGNPNAARGRATNQGMTPEQAAQERQRMGMPPQIRSLAERDKLPSGSRYLDPNGVERIKP